ncbi:hypothetical protein BZB76_0434 [Actinomadura pelletieri DSM 43383]|uniref:Beta/gamma crystallin n=1 Tax=Actinomadura pelletieri DSM 43383 TaxID=1120940 RepID=A0A495QYI7_9ACTN|nr:hypothetical protein [Actinomadura pelletieri]RKS78996.1 hypothetical protein BZB76_0434 [Actinomadura pelletieri DSM 43383]
MRRPTTVLAALATGAALTLTAATPAAAAQGTLGVSGNEYTDPSQGCYNGLFRPLVVVNHTDTPVIVYDDDNCHSEVVGIVEPGQSQAFEFGNSVLVPR